VAPRTASISARCSGLTDMRVLEDDAAAIIPSNRGRQSAKSAKSATGATT
jgi:hypothetical protein